MELDVKKLREEFKLSQQELAEKTGIPKGRINAWEQRGTQPKLADYNVLVSFFENLRSQKTNTKTEEFNVHGGSPSMTAIVNLTEANRQMAESNNKLADGHIRLIALMEKATVGAGVENQSDGPSTFDKILEAVAVIASGKKWATKEAAEKALRTLVFGDQAKLSKANTYHE